MNDRLSDALRRVDELSGATPPSDLVARSRERAAGLRGQRSRRVRRYAAVATSAVALTFAAAFTPPGRAATGWLAELAGFGDEPSLDQKGSVPGSAVVLTSGELSDGTPYEVVAKRVLFGIGPDTRQANDNRPALLCFQVDFPQRTDKGQGGHCTDGNENGSGLGNESIGLVQEPTPDLGSTADEDGPGLILGLVEIPEAASIRVFASSDGNESQPIPSQLIEVTGELLARTGTDTPVGVFVAPIDGEMVAAGRRDQVEVRALAYAPDGRVLGQSDVFFPPVCPPAPEPPPPPPAGTPPPRPADPQSVREAIEADPCLLYEAAGPPPKVSRHRLSREPVPEDLRSLAAAAGHPIETAPSAAYEPLFDPGYEASSVDQAVGQISREVPDRIPEVEDHGSVSNADVYLGVSSEDDRLVYLVRYEVTGFGDDNADGSSSPGLPMRFIGLFDVLSGERLWQTAERSG